MTAHAIGEFSKSMIGIGAELAIQAETATLIVTVS